MNVTKRSGREEAFNRMKIIDAIIKSGCPEHIAARIGGVIHDQARDGISVEEIQDEIELWLMRHGQHEPARDFIRYRERRSVQREERIPPDRQAIADYIFYSKYSRFNEVLDRRETWEESVDRVAEMHAVKYPHLVERITETFDQYVRPKKVLPSMRSIQFGGRAIEVNHARMYNCSYTLLDRPRAFSELFFLLLSGCGVGYSVQRDHIRKLPKVTEPFKESVAFYSISDDIEGWAEAVNVLLFSYFDPSRSYVEFDYHYIRPLGSPLITSGGKAPGHLPLKWVLEQIRSIMNRAVGRKLRPIECHDICCILAEGVLAGGIRRSSMISLFDYEDDEMMACKTFDWIDKSPWRAMANNSVILNRGDAELHSKLHCIFEMTQEFGEPGFFFTEDNDYGTNPCGEIGLHPVYDGVTGIQFCNLCEINVADLGDDWKQEFILRCSAASFIGTLQAGYTDFPYLTEVTEEITKRDALLGVSLTGIMDFPPLRENPMVLHQGVEMIKHINFETSKLININPAARLTCVKPSGTASLVLGGVGSGIHPHHSRRYIRRVTANPIEPVFQQFREVNPHMCKKKPNGDWVIEFPIECSDLSPTLEDLTDIEFMREVSYFYRHWVKPGSLKDPSHNVSATVTVDDWTKVYDWIVTNRVFIGAMSFLARNSNVYPFMPREAITEENESLWQHLMKNYRPVNYVIKQTHDRFETGCTREACEIQAT